MIVTAILAIALIAALIGDAIISSGGGWILLLLGIGLTAGLIYPAIKERGPAGTYFVVGFVATIVIFMAGWNAAIPPQNYEIPAHAKTKFKIVTLDGETRVIPIERLDRTKESIEYLNIPTSFKKRIANAVEQDAVELNTSGRTSWNRTAGEIRNWHQWVAERNQERLVPKGTGMGSVWLILATGFLAQLVLPRLKFLSGSLIGLTIGLTAFLIGKFTELINPELQGASIIGFLGYLFITIIAWIIRIIFDAIREKTTHKKFTVENVVTSGLAAVIVLTNPTSFFLFLTGRMNDLIIKNLDINMDQVQFMLTVGIVGAQLVIAGGQSIWNKFTNN